MKKSACVKTKFCFIMWSPQIVHVDRWKQSKEVYYAGTSVCLQMFTLLSTQNFETAACLSHTVIIQSFAFKTALEAFCSDAVWLEKRSFNKKVQLVFLNNPRTRSDVNGSRELAMIPLISIILSINHDKRLSYCELTVCHLLFDCNSRRPYACHLCVRFLLTSLRFGSFSFFVCLLDHCQLSVRADKQIWLLIFSFVQIYFNAFRRRKKEMNVLCSVLLSSSHTDMLNKAHHHRALQKWVKRNL